MAESDFPLPKSSYAELSKMIHAYYLASKAAKGQPVEVPAVASQAGIDPTQLSRNNKFFAEVGIVSGGRKKVLTSNGESLGRGVDFGDDQIIAGAWGQIVAASDFLTRAVNAVRIRGGMDVPSLQNHIALTAGATKTGPVMTGANAVIEALVRSGRLADEGGTIRVGSDRPPVPHGDEEDEVVLAADDDAALRKSSPLISSSRRAAPTTFWTDLSSDSSADRSRAGGGLTVNININLEADDPEKAAETLSRILDVLSGLTPGSEPDPEQ